MVLQLLKLEITRGDFEIQKWMIKDLKLSGGELVMFSFLYKMTVIDLKCTAFEASKQLEINYNTARAQLERLISKGYVVKEEKPSEIAPKPLYFVNIDNVYNEVLDCRG